jgi:hypothetical protein
MASAFLYPFPLPVDSLSDGCQNSYMGKLTPPLNKWRSRSWQAVPYTLLGTILFAWVSSAHLNQFFSVYLVLLAAQLGTVGIYLLMNRLRSRDRQNR